MDTSTLRALVWLHHQTCDAQKQPLSKRLRTVNNTFSNIFRGLFVLQYLALLFISRIKGELGKTGADTTREFACCIECASNNSAHQTVGSSCKTQTKRTRRAYQALGRFVKEICHASPQASNQTRWISKDVDSTNNSVKICFCLPNVMLLYRRSQSI